MNKEIIFFNDAKSMFSKDNINKIIIKINKIQINKDMKKFLLIASINLISSVKTTKALEYQLQNFRNSGKVLPEKSQSKYLNKIIKELNSMSASDFTNNINNLINFIVSNNVTIKI